MLLTHYAGAKRARNAVLAVITALAVVFTGLMGAVPAAYAATPGINTSMLLNGNEVYGDLPVKNEGDTLTLRVQYSSDVQPGQQVEFELSDNVTIPADLAGNEAIASVEQDGQKVTITFKDPWPAGVNQGVWDLNLKLNAVEKSEQQTVSWKVDGEESTLDIIVKNEGDSFANVKDGESKAVNDNKINEKGFISVDSATCDVTLAAGILDHEIAYTLRLDSKEARNDFSIADQLPAGLEYVADSFSAQLTSWDANGLNKQTDAFPYSPSIDDNAFTSTVNTPANSQLAITYKVKVTNKELLEQKLSDACKTLGGAPGTFSHVLPNTATFGTTPKTAEFRLNGVIAGVNGKDAFVKKADWTHQNVAVAEDGTLTPAQDITYTLGANLTKWNGTSPNFTLNQNVVIEDTLPSQASWNTADANFITSAQLELTEAADCPAVADFADEAYAGMYCVDGQTLRVNVGKDNTKNISIEAKALINTITGLAVKNDETSVQDAVAYTLRNVGKFHYGAKDAYEAGFNSFPIVLPETDEGYNDPKAFSKTGKPQSTTVEQNGTVKVDYTFVVGAGKDIDLRESTIVDYVDATLFELDDLSALELAGVYAGTTLAGDHFAVAQDDEGNLLISLSDEGKSVVDAKGADKAFSLKLTLETRTFEGKETLTLKNKATLFGANDEPLYWSETQSEATSYGDEAEVRKRLFDATSEDWVETLPAQLDPDGNLINDVFTYRVEFIPRGNYNHVAITDVNDVLPEQTEFLGFVAEADAATGANPTAGPVDLAGNIQARYADGVVQLVQKEGTKLEAGQPIEAFFAVKLTDTSEPVVNKIGTTEATILPVSTFDITKTVTGVQAANSAVPASVNVTATWEQDGESFSKLLEVPTDGTPLAFGEQLPLGTEVTLTEDALTDASGIAWAAPKWSGAGVTTEKNDAATVTIGETNAAGVSLVNEARASVASVLLEKKLEGDAADLVTLDGYEVTATIDTTALGDDATAQPDRVVTIKPGETTELENLPVGATVTFSEAKPVDTDLLTWAEPVISPESIVVTEDHFVTAPTVTVTNSVTHTVGTFDIVKNVTGAEAENPAVPETVEVTATWDGGEKVLTVPTDGTPVAFGEELLIGTEVTLTEAPLANGSGIVWAAPSWAGTGVALTESGDATVTIGRDADARVTLENHAATSTAGISLIKQLAGEAAAEVDEATEFTVRASWDLGEGEQHTDLVINSVEPTVLDEQLPAGTVVTLTEQGRPEIAGVDWGSIAFAGERVTATADNAAEFVVSSEDGTVDLITVTNEANWAPGTFSLAKQIAGASHNDADVPETVTVQATWFDGEAEQSKDIELPTDGTRVPFGEMLPHNTKVVLTEAVVAPSDRFTWATPAWSEERVATADGGVAELTIGAALDTEVTVTNTAIATTGYLAVTKTLTGEGALEVAEDAEFPVTATWTDLDGKKQEREITLTANEATVIDGVAFGTDVTLVEGTLPDTGATKWLSAEWTSLGENAELSADGTTAVVRVTGEAGSTVALSLANEYAKAPLAPAPGDDDADDADKAPNQGGGLSVTGATGFGLLAALGAMLAAAGAWLLLRRRRNV